MANLEVKLKFKYNMLEIIFQFKLPPCCILSFGWFPCFWFVYADVSEHVWTWPMKMEETRVFRNDGT